MAARLRWIAVAASLSLSLAPALTPALAQGSGERTLSDSLLPHAAYALFDSLTTSRLAPGVTHLSGVMAAGPFRVNVIAAELSSTALGLVAVRAGEGLLGRERTSVLASEWQARARAAGDGVAVLAAVNADFFSLTTGEQLASQVTEDRVLKARDGAASDPRPDFLVSANGTPYIADATYAGVLGVGTRTIALDAVNSLPERRSWLGLFDAAFGRALPADSLNARTLPLRQAAARGDTILLVRTPPALINSQAAGAPDDTQLGLAATGAAKARLALLTSERDTIRVVHRFAPVGQGVRTLVGGRPVIVAAGRSLHRSNGVFPGAPAEFATTRHPRTAVGIGRNGTLVLLVTVDGRQGGSVGMSLQELAKLMISLGAVDALNLDGGGSTTAVVGGRVVNSPSDANGERTVANALLLVLR